MPGYWLTPADPRSESLPKGWDDEIVVHTMRRNSDGTITVVALVNVYDNAGNCWSADRVIKLRNKSKSDPIPDIFAED